MFIAFHAIMFEGWTLWV